MINFFKNNFNLQIFISYSGIIPFIYILFDISLFNIFTLDLIKDFIFFYTLIISTFIGAMRWGLVKLSNIYEVLFGFFPSLLATFLIIFYLHNININFILFLILAFLIIQLFGDFIFYKYDRTKNPPFFFFFVRLPATSIIVLIISYLISV